MDEIKFRPWFTYSHCPLDDKERARLAMLLEMGIQDDEQLPDVHCRPVLAGSEIAADREQYRLVKCVCSFITEDAYRLVGEP